MLYIVYLLYVYREVVLQTVEESVMFVRFNPALFEVRLWPLFPTVVTGFRAAWKASD